LIGIDNRGETEMIETMKQALEALQRSRVFVTTQEVIA
jgi:hypothetical protein